MGAAIVTPFGTCVPLLNVKHLSAIIVRSSPVSPIGLLRNRLAHKRIEEMQLVKSKRCCGRETRSKMALVKVIVFEKPVRKFMVRIRFASIA